MMLSIGGVSLFNGIAQCAFSREKKCHVTIIIKWVEMADLHNDVTYQGWDKTSVASHRKIPNVSYACKKKQQKTNRKTDCLHVLIIATQRGGVFISESNCRVGTWCMALIA